jgi:hypothetical protein
MRGAGNGNHLKTSHMLHHLLVLQNGEVFSKHRKVVV